MLRHDNVAGDNEEIAETNAFERIFKKFHGRIRGQVGLTMKTTEGEEVELPRLLVAYALAFHVLRGYSGWGRDAPRSPQGDLEREPKSGFIRQSASPSPVPKSEGPGAPPERYPSAAQRTLVPYSTKAAANQH